MEGSMPVDCLPNNPDLDHLRSQAKRLLGYANAGVPEALALIDEFHPHHPASLKLSDAQLVTARRYGFASWPKLKAHLDIVRQLTRSPHRVAASGDLVDEFLRLACLTYGDDYPARTRDGDALLRANPELATANVYTMAATGSIDPLRTALATDAALANTQGGPFAWEPLLYLTYGRLDRAGAYADAAAMLLEHGADPNAGFLWDGLTSPFTAVTGAFGGGEGDQPRHRAGLDLACVLLEAGADPNDAQTLYNCGLGGSWTDDTTHLELLLEFGLGRGDGGPWKARLGPTLQSPEQLLRDELATAALRGGVRRTRLLLEHGAEVNGIGGHPAFGGRTPLELALLHGHSDVAALLAASGATAQLDDEERSVAALMSADGKAVEALPADVVNGIRSIRPELINHAAGHGKVAAVRLLAGLGWDVNHRARSTPLHDAAWNDDVAMARTLIELGADQAIVDTEHQSTPLGWADYGGKRQVASYLRSVAGSTVR
jgi:ankyrin repeat protein